MKKSKKKLVYALGTGEAGVPEAPATTASAAGGTGKGMGQGMSTVIQQLPGIFDAIIYAADNHSYSKQPIVNVNTMRNMVDPYKSSKPSANMGMGGLVETPDILSLDGDDGGKKRKRKDKTSTVGTTYGTSGIVGKEGLPTEQEAILNTIQYLNNNWSNQSDTPSNVYRPEFEHEAINQPLEINDVAAKQAVNKNGVDMVAAYGGSVPVNAEGGEVIETPDGGIGKIKGAKHESGGVDLNLPGGTKIFSDRLKIDGKSMEERKLSREKRNTKLDRLLSDKPTDVLLKNTVDRSKEIIDIEDKQDMAIQKVASQIYSVPTTMAYGGRVAAYGDDLSDPPLYPNYFGIDFGKYDLNTTPMSYGNPIPYANEPQPIAKPGNSFSMPETVSGSGLTNTTPGLPIAGKGGSTIPKTGLTAGDYVGLAGNLFNAIAPIINTKNAAAATKPNLNKFLKFGKDALDTNTTTQAYVDNQRANANIDIEQSANSAIARNRNGATSINTLRALDIATNVNANKAKGAVNDTFSKQMIDILGARTGLENQRDAAVMGGAERAEEKNTMDLDNYFTNNAQNLTNFGTNIQGIGRSLNQSHANNVDTKLLSELSQYGLSFDAKGNLISIKQ